MTSQGRYSSVTQRSQEESKPLLESRGKSESGNHGRNTVRNPTHDPCVSFYSTYSLYPLQNPPISPLPIESNDRTTSTITFDNSPLQTPTLPSLPVRSTTLIVPGFKSSLTSPSHTRPQPHHSFHLPTRLRSSASRNCKLDIGLALSLGTFQHFFFTEWTRPGGST